MCLLAGFSLQGGRSQCQEGLVMHEEERCKHTFSLLLVCVGQSEGQVERYFCISSFTTALLFKQISFISRSGGCND